VDIEGSRVLNAFDMLTIAPRFTAITRTFGTSVNDGTLNIQFSGSAKVTAVEIIPGELRTLRVITEIQDSANNKIISRDTTYRR
jgi:glycerol-3-phosphate responsive antiterminator